jgi:hypothetical protein
MTNDEKNKISEVADGLDDVAVTVDELKYDPGARLRPGTIDTLKRAIDEATDAVDELDDQEE